MTSSDMAVRPAAEESVQSFQLSAAYPNPFNSRTTVRCFLQQNQAVAARIVNLRGQTMKVLCDGWPDRGGHLISWDGTNEIGEDAASGIYWLQMRTAGALRTIKMILLR